jgi:hypothetical protein
VYGLILPAQLLPLKSNRINRKFNSRRAKQTQEPGLGSSNEPLKKINNV